VGGDRRGIVGDGALVKEKFFASYASDMILPCSGGKDDAELLREP
jgi:hypothetical protein